MFFSILTISLLVVLVLLIKTKFTSPSIYYRPENLKFLLHRDKIEAYKIKSDSTNSEKRYKIWESSENFEKIDTAFFFDYDQDEEKELIVLFWRYGDYLGKRNFLKPIVGDENLSQHISIYEIEPYIHLRWGGSSLPKPILNLKPCPSDELKLCATESTYENFPKPSNNIKLEWKGWWWEKIIINCQIL